MPAPSWHAEDRLLREQGCTIDRLAETFDREPSSIRRIVSPGAREQQNASRRRLYHKRAADPAFRRKEADRIRALRERRARLAADHCASKALGEGGSRG